MGSGCGSRINRLTPLILIISPTINVNLFLFSAHQLITMCIKKIKKALGDKKKEKKNTFDLGIKFK
jgi:hypothetical protein